MSHLNSIILQKSYEQVEYRLPFLLTEEKNIREN